MELKEPCASKVLVQKFTLSLYDIDAEEIKWRRD
jgi:hypothetical protein